LCCRYFALQIDNPKTADDYDNIRWYLVHENVVAFTVLSALLLASAAALRRATVPAAARA